MSDVIPKHDDYDPTHEFIWNVLAYKLTEKDFEAIKMALIEREETLEKIQNSEIWYVRFGDNMYQPRNLPEKVKEDAIRYADWNCAYDICMLISKYTKFFQ